MFVLFNEKIARSLKNYWFAATSLCVLVSSNFYESP